MPGMNDVVWEQLKKKFNVSEPEPFKLGKKDNENLDVTKVDPDLVDRLDKSSSDFKKEHGMGPLVARSGHRTPQDQARVMTNLFKKGLSLDTVKKLYSQPQNKKDTYVDKLYGTYNKSLNIESQKSKPAVSPQTIRMAPWKTLQIPYLQEQMLRKGTKIINEALKKGHRITDHLPRPEYPYSTATDISVYNRGRRMSQDRIRRLIEVLKRNRLKVKVERRKSGRVHGLHVYLPRDERNRKIRLWKQGKISFRGQVHKLPTIPK